ncbi:hypothetical protein C1H46_015482 [Malus baccata]|uniref:Uncharacterized protein n=1 Tax=Malus baccata TaxID=106549 RepID=A0A540MK76_MALBA|nr:hypothetical protein C1H46_015482 [Malus baccata]
MATTLQRRCRGWVIELYTPPAKHLIDLVFEDSHVSSPTLFPGNLNIGEHPSKLLDSSPCFFLQ